MVYHRQVLLKKQTKKISKIASNTKNNWFMNLFKKSKQNNIYGLEKWVPKLVIFTHLI